MKLSQCVGVTDGRLINGDCEFGSVSTDTRKIQSGDLFVALRGERFDAHDFLSEAVSAGACALVVEAEQDLAVPQLIVDDTTLALGQIAALKRRGFRGKVVGITGSSGKTSVKGMLAAILRQCGSVCATAGNYNNQIGVPLTLLALDDAADFAVIEMGTNSPGEIGYLAGLVHPQVALVNNIMPAHLGGFGSLAAIAKEKAAIYSFLTEDEVAIINLGDNFAPQFVNATRHVRQIGFLMDQPRDQLEDQLTASNLVEDAIGRPLFRLHHGEEYCDIQLNVLGRHNVKNALAASACAIACGIALDRVRDGLKQYAGDKGRMQAKQATCGAALIDDTYNANPGSVRAAIDYLAARPQQKVLVLGDLGELGEGAATELRDLGSYAREAGIDSLFTCGAVARFAAEGFGEEAEAFNSQSALLEALEQHLNANAVVLVKGSRSARMENVVQALSRSGDEQ